VVPEIGHVLNLNWVTRLARKERELLGLAVVGRLLRCVAQI
jgi:hypothetical protein